MRGRIPAFVIDVFKIYTKNRISRSAAALSYLVTLSVFPLMICLNAMLGSTDINKGELVSVLYDVIPAGTIEVMIEYYNYISFNNSALLLIVGIGVMLLTSSAAFRELLTTMADIHENKREFGLLSMIFSFALSILFLAAIYVSFIAVVAGEWLVEIIANIIPIGGFADIWLWLRFVIVFCIIYVIIYLVYFATAPHGEKIVPVPRGIGAFVASVSLVAVSMLFSWFISMSVRYTLVYGSLASVIILMVWLYVCCNILILGNVINVVLYKRKKQKILSAYHAALAKEK